MEHSEPVIEWLLEPDNPPIRYLTLTRLLGRPEEAAEVKNARDDLMGYGVTRGILEQADRWLPIGDHGYMKYRGGDWQVIFLGEFRADGENPTIASALGELLENRTWISGSGLQCLTANLLAAFRRLGYGAHPVVVEETERLARRIVADGGIRCQAMDYSLLSRCYMALPKVVQCFAEVHEADRSTSVRRALELVVDRLLEHDVFRYVPGTRRGWTDILEHAPRRAELPEGATVKSWVAESRVAYLAEHGLGEPEAKAGWKRFAFPLHYNSDILEAMYALALADVPMCHEVEEAVSIIREKRGADGRWVLDATLNGKMWVDVEEKGKPSKWITYRALHVLDHFGGA